MKPQTFVGLLGALGAVLLASFVSIQNRDLLTEPFRIGGGFYVPLYLALVLVFAAGLVPLATLRLIESVRGDLAARRSRRDSRAQESLDRTFQRAIDFERDGLLERAAREIEIVLELRPDDFAGLLLYGRVLRLLDRHDEAISIHQRASAAHPRSVAVLYELIDDYQARGDDEVAEEIRNRILRDFPDRGAAVLRQRRNRAMSDGDWGRATRFQEDLDALLGARHALRDPDLERGMAYQRGVGLLEEDRPADAAEIFSRLLDEEPRFIPATIMLGEARLLEERWQDAVEIWVRGYQASHSPVLLQRIEDHFIEREQPEQAIQTLRRLIAADPDDLLPRFFLGRLYYRLEMLPEAQKALYSIGGRIQPSPTYHFLLGRIHERLGEIRLAAESYLKSARQLGVHNAEYVCRKCEARESEWLGRCKHCGSWNSIELAIEEESLSADDLSMRSGPIWTPHGFERPS